MADQVKQLAFKDFSIAELQAGTAANVLTTNASTHYVIKSIEATQGFNDDAVTATATLGLTSGLGTGQYASLGTVAKKDRVGISGSAIMDASSTLTIRPQAKSIIFVDEQYQISMENANDSNKWRIIKTPSVNNTVDAGLTSRTTVDKTGQAFTNPQLTMSDYPNNFTIYYTNAHNLNLKILFRCHTTSGVGFEVHNADDGTNYGYYSVNYGMPFWDGGRYIFMWNNQSPYGLKYFDLDETATNLASANTMGGGVGQDYYHGLISSSNTKSSGGSYANRFCTFLYDRHNDKRFYIQYFSGNASCMMWEIPTGTLTNGQTTAATKCIEISRNTWSSGTDPFGGNSGSNFNMGYVVNNYLQDYRAHFRLTYNKTLERYVLYMVNQNYIYLCTWTLNEYNSTGDAAILDQGTTNYGLQTVSVADPSAIGVGSDWFVNYAQGNGRISTTDTQFTNAVTPFRRNQDTYGYSSSLWFDNNIMYGKSNTSPRQLYSINLLTGAPTLITTGLSTSEADASYGNLFWHGFGSPSATTQASRNYTVAPSLKVRVSGVLSDQ